MAVLQPVRPRPGRNAFGLITACDGLGFPARIDLVPLSEVTVKGTGGQITKYRICGTDYEPYEVWHERQYTVSGMALGLSPVAYAAWSIGEYLSIQQFALDWFSNGAMPSAHLKNTAKVINPQQATEVKDRFKAATANRDLFVTGMDWQYDMIQAEQAGLTGSLPSSSASPTSPGSSTARPTSSTPPPWAAR